MPEFPEKPTETKSSGGKVTIGNGIPIVKSISGYFLGNTGWKHEKGNTYSKDGNIVSYDGVHWTFNGRERIEFMHELEHLIKNKK